MMPLPSETLAPMLDETGSEQTEAPSAAPGKSYLTPIVTQLKDKAPVLARPIQSEDE